MTDLTSLTIATARKGLRSREFSALELANAYLANMERARRLPPNILDNPSTSPSTPQAAD